MVKKKINAAKGYYENNLKKFVPILTFLAGFAWDSLTLKRIDRLLDNVILLVYLILAGVCLVLSNMIEGGRVQNQFLNKQLKWVQYGRQFFYGGLFSAYVVYYFQSSSLTKTSIFLFILAVLFVSNEFQKERLSHILLQLTLYYLLVFSFFIFFIPVALKVMSYRTFFAAGVLGLFVIFFICYILNRHQVLGGLRYNLSITAIVITIFVLMNVFYVMNWIPPVPLSLKFSGIFHDVQRSESGFELTYQRPPWYKFWQKNDNPFLYKKGDRIYCFTSIFAPNELKQRIYHHWLIYDKGEWLETNKIGFTINGGRYGGYRGFTYKTKVAEGKWRVEVRTEEDQLLGDITFEVEDAEGEPIPMQIFKYK